MRKPSRIKRHVPTNSPAFIFVGILSFCLAVTASNMAGAAIAPTSADPPGWFVDLNLFSESAHHNFTCEACHGDMSEQGKKHPDTVDARLLKNNATRIYDYHRCRSCHRESYERYLRGAHAKALAEEQKAGISEGPAASERVKAPTCGDCHSAHYGKSHLSRVATGKQMTAVCGVCHPAQKATYLENYHGKVAVNLRDEASAYCTDCHGAHDCVSLKERKTALAACQRCHPEAGERFTQFVIHPTTKGLAKDDKEKRRHVTIIKIVTLIMAVIVILVVGFFYGHSFLWLLRELHERLRKHK
ncbi:MAG: hypothetical protein JRL30_06945 [Deltaproteobacteria bacterium]|nr:hypothetical protein [Deltaproteobacteria bacterium]